MVNTALSEYVAQHFRLDMLEVESVGNKKLRVRLPPEFHGLTEFCKALHVEFGANVDVVVENDGSGASSAVLEIHEPSISVEDDRTENDRVEKQSPAASFKDGMFVQVVASILIAWFVVMLSPVVTYAVKNVTSAKF